MKVKLSDVNVKIDAKHVISKFFEQILVAGGKEVCGPKKWCQVSDGGIDWFLKAEWREPP